MYESWVKNIDLSTIQFTATDPDHPNVEKLGKNSTKQARTGIAMIKIVQSADDCLRGMFTDYLGDKALDGTSPNLLIVITFNLQLAAALHFTTPWCCTGSRHSESVSFGQFFKGCFLYQDERTGDLYYGMPNDPSDRIMIVPPRKEKRKAQDKRRTSDERKSLVSRLVAWRYNAHAMDPLAAVRPLSFIIDNAGIALLAKLHSEDISNYRQIKVLLDQSMEWEEEWSKKIFDIIQQFEEDLVALRRTTATQKKNQQKRMKVVQNIISFEQDSKENEERIRQQVLQRYSKQQHSPNSVQILQTSTVDNV
jgi:hypothetical protein